MTELAAAYKGQSAFVTGHTGFKGAWLVSWLSRLGAPVTGYSLAPPTRPNLFDALSTADRVRHIVADVRDRERLMAEMRVASPSVVFHLAARALVRQAYAEPRETFETNVLGTVNVLEAIRSTPSVEAVVVVTSDKCYDNQEIGRAFRETDPLGGRDPYAASKAGAEIATAAYRESFFAHGPAVASARAGNVIGGGDWAPDRIVPDIVRSLGADQPVAVRNPDAVRPWQHVLEPLSGYLLLGARLLEDRRTFAGPWNFGPAAMGDEKPVRWVVERFLGHWGSGSWTTPENRDGQPHEAQRLSLDSTKAREQLGWTPVWDAATAVRRTAAWYREYERRPVAARRLVEEDLAAYEADARKSGRSWAVTASENTTT